MIKKVFQVCCDTCGLIINYHTDGVAISDLEKANILFLYDKSIDSNRHFCCQFCLNRYEAESKVRTKDAVHRKKLLSSCCPKCNRLVKPNNGSGCDCNNCISVFKPRVKF